MRILSFLSIIGLFFSMHLLASDAVQQQTTIAELKKQIFQQMKDAAQENSVSVYGDHDQLQSDPSFFKGIWQGALLGTATTIFFVPGAIGAGISRALVGKGSGIGHNMMSGIVGFSAALGALPTALLGVPVAPIGASVGAAIGTGHAYKEKRKVQKAVQRIWGHLVFVYDLLLVGETDFMALTEAERIQELEELSENINKEVGISFSKLRSSQFITYADSDEDRLRAQIMTSILKSRAFRTSQGQSLDENTLEAFIEYLHRGKPESISENQSKEAALLVIRFIDKHLENYSRINTADAIEALMKGT